MILGNLFVAAAPVAHALFKLAWFVLLARILFSWVRPAPGPGLVRQLVEAVYEISTMPLRNLAPRRTRGPAAPGDPEG